MNIQPQRTKENILKHKVQLPYGPNIIINADDYGYCQERCKGIMELVQQKCISSVSVMVNAPHIHRNCKPLVQYLESQSQQRSLTPQQIKDASRTPTNYTAQHSQFVLSVGLHLNLTQFNSCCVQSDRTCQNYLDIPSIMFQGKKHLYDHLHLFGSNPKIVQFVQGEVRAQIQKFIELFNNKPTHLDGHNHVHIIPQIAECVCRVARLYGIYKVRLPLPHNLLTMYNQSQNIFNNIFAGLAQQSRKIYDKQFAGFGCHWGEFNSIGYLKCSNYAQAPHKYVEIMCHPGYKQQVDFEEFSTCPFSKSQEREYQLKMLKSQLFRQVVGKLRSYRNLKKNNNEKSALIYSKLLSGSGNLTTSLRLAKILQSQLGFMVYFMDVPDNGTTQSEALRMKNMVYELGIKLVIGINLTRTASVMNRAVNQGAKQEILYKIPYLLIVAGTDANITLQESPSSPKLVAINEGIRNCECLISLSQQMKQFMHKYLVEVDIQKDVVQIKQSTLNASIGTSQLIDIGTKTISQSGGINGDQGIQARPYIIFPTSFRKVKAVHHVLNQLNHLIQKHNIDVFIVGPIINSQYYNNTKGFLNKVQYLGCIPSEQYLHMLKGSQALINCSESQGMSCSILEAFAYKIPVIARKNQGNCELITNGINGFIYQTGSEFINIVQALSKDYGEIKQRICESAYQKLIKQFSYEQQVDMYGKMITQYFQGLTYQLPIQTQYLPSKDASLLLMSLKNIHGISPINLLIFQKFYTQKFDEVQSRNYFVQPILHKQSCVNILDVGCGNGIFSIYFLINFMKYHQSKDITKFNLYFLDIDKNCLSNVKVNLRALQQLCANSFNTNCIIQSTTLLVSNMFQQLQQTEIKDAKFDIILANMPQTPFNNCQSRMDKNGGKDGFQLTTILIQNYAKYLRNSSSFLMMLYSFMNDSQKFADLLKTNGSKIKWKSSTEVHEISKQDYQKMEQGLSALIEQKMRSGQADIELTQQIFKVPADLRIIQPIY